VSTLAPPAASDTVFVAESTTTSVANDKEPMPLPAESKYNSTTE
jgi:hypothetical protein